MAKNYDKQLATAAKADEKKTKLLLRFAADVMKAGNGKTADEILRLVADAGSNSLLVQSRFAADLKIPGVDNV